MQPQRAWNPEAAKGAVDSTGCGLPKMWWFHADMWFKRREPEVTGRCPALCSSRAGCDLARCSHPVHLALLVPPASQDAPSCSTPRFKPGSGLCSCRMALCRSLRMCPLMQPLLPCRWTHIKVISRALSQHEVHHHVLYVAALIDCLHMVALSSSNGRRGVCAWHLPAGCLHRHAYCHPSCHHCRVEEFKQCRPG